MRTLRPHTYDASPSVNARAAAVLGNALFHTTADRYDAVKAMDEGFSQLYGELAVQCGDDGAVAVLFATPSGVTPQGHAAIEHTRQNAHDHPERALWWKTMAKPIFDSWVKFRSDQLTGGASTLTPDYIALQNRFETNWSEYERWHAVLEQLRAAAASKGLRVDSPPVTPLPTTVWKDASDLAKRGGGAVIDTLSSAGTLAKVAIYGGLGLLGLVAVGSLVSNMRTGKDPAAPYLALAKRARAGVRQ